MLHLAFAYVLSAMVLAGTSATPHAVVEHVSLNSIRNRATIVDDVTYTGQATFYSVGLGACGITNDDSDLVVAVSHTFFDTFPGWNGANPNDNPICGRKITATYQGKSVTATVVHRCVGCDTYDLDFSPAAFSRLADLGIGRLTGVNWVLD